MPTRTQTFLNLYGEGRFYATLFGTNVISDDRSVAQIRGWQRTSDDNHGYSRDLLGLHDMGGSFYSEKKWCTSSQDGNISLLQGDYAGYLRTYKGPIAAWSVSQVASDSVASWPASAEIVPADLLVSSGATAIARTIPTTPAVSVLQILGELRQKLPAIPGWALKKALNPRVIKQVDHVAKEINFSRKWDKPSPREVARTAGSEHLNISFGVLPTARDFRDFYWAHKRADKMWAAYIAQGKRLTRRRYEFPMQESTVTEDLGYRYPAVAVSPSAYLLEPGPTTKTVTNRRRIWFSGAYVYAVPEKGLPRTETYMSRIYGTRMSPEVLWNLAPWSWMVDWFTNTGDIMRNLSALSTDGTLLKWGYVMCETTQTVTFTWQGRVQQDNQWRPLVLEQSFNHTIKRRIGASPFGFGITFGGLSPRQIAIAASVGITR